MNEQNTNTTPANETPTTATATATLEQVQTATEPAKAKGKAKGKAKAKGKDKPSNNGKVHGNNGKDTGTNGTNGKAKPISCLDAAAKILRKRTKGMTCRGLIEKMKADGMWESPSGKTPDASLSAALYREINGKGKDSRFKKVEGGFAFNK